MENLMELDSVVELLSKFYFFKTGDHVNVGFTINYINLNRYQHDSTILNKIAYSINLCVTETITKRSENI